MARSAHNKTDFSEIKKIFESSKYTLIDEEYVFKKKINFCDSEGYYYQMDLFDFKKGKKPSKFGNGNNYTSKNIQNFLKRNGNIFTMISSNINYVTEDTEFMCNKCKNNFVSNFHSIKKRKNCPNCPENVSLNIEKIKERIKLISPDIIILSDKYSPNVKLKCKCRIDGHVWYAMVDKLSVGKGCPECKRTSHVGENNNKWKGGITPLQNKLRGELGLWKRNSLIKTKNKCVITGKKTNLIVHHLYPFHKIVAESLVLSGIYVFDICNYNYEEYLKIASDCVELHEKYGFGIPIEKNLHDEFHVLYGKDEFTEEYFYEFYFKKTGRIFKKGDFNV